MGLLPTSIPTSLDQLNPFSKGQGGDEIAPSLFIRELTGAKRLLALRSRSLPYRPVSFGRGVQHTRKTTYQGNPQSTQQVLGPEEGDCTLRGMWKSRFIGGCVVQSGFDREVTRAADLVDFFDSIRKAGQTVMVQWGAVVRVGIMKAFEATWHRTQDVEWEAEFEWRSQGEITTRVPDSARSAPSLLDKLNKLTDLLALGPDFLLPDINAIVVSTIAETRKKVALVFDAIRQVQKLGRLPADTVGAIGTNVESLRGDVLETISVLAELPINMVAATKYTSDQLSAETWRREMSDAWMSVLDGMSTQLAQITNRSSPPPLKIVTVRQDTTLYKISLDAYGTADLANFLAEVNVLDNTVVAAGTVIIVPPKPDDATVSR